MLLKLTRNLKIKTIIILLGTLSILSILVTSYIGLQGMYKINENMSYMYDNDLSGIAKLGTARGEFLTVRLNLEKALVSNDAKYAQNINEHYTKTLEALKQYEETDLDEIEREKLKSIYSGLNEYMADLEVIKQNAANNTVSQDATNALMTGGEIVESALVELREHDEKKAQELNASSNEFYETSINNAFYLGIGISVILLFLQFIVIYIVVKSIKAAISNLNTIASGDLTLKVNADDKNEFGAMKKALHQTIENIKEVITSIKRQANELEIKAEGLSAASEEMSSSSQNVAVTIQQVAQGTSSQADYIINTNMIFNKFNEQLDMIVSSISNIDSSSNSIEDMAEDSNNKMNHLTDSMKKVNDMFNDFANKIGNLGLSINRINEITNLINGIADQTNLLALNASIEAARAGQAGRGFAVVAEEIRNLAEQSKSFSKNINTLINEISVETNVMVNTSNNVKSEMKDQLNIINTAMISFDSIINGIRGITPQISGASSSMNQIQNEKNSIVEKLEGASAVSEEIAASAEEIAASAEEMDASSGTVANTATELNYMTKEIVKSLDRFKI